MRSFCEEALINFGTPDRIAEIVARSLIGADICGHESHGVIRLATTYSDLINDQQIVPRNTPTVQREANTFAQIDGNMAFGQLVGKLAVSVIIEKARKNGIAIVGIRNGNHLGRIGEWAERVAEEGLLFCAFVNLSGGSFMVAPPGSAERRLGTNPISFGIPTYDVLTFPIILDMATSQVAHGKITKRDVEEKDLPENWTSDSSGNPVTDASKFENGDGALLTLGGRSTGHKGFGLSVVAELFAGLIGDSTVSGQNSECWANNSATFIAIDPTEFSKTSDIRKRIRALTNHIRETKYSTSVEAGESAYGSKALLPGEAEYLTRVDRKRHGIPISLDAIEKLSEVAMNHGGKWEITPIENPGS